MTSYPFMANPLLSSMMKDSNLLAGFININTVSSGDRDVEQEIISKVAGYGRQLGRILDVMKILLEKDSLQDLSAGESRAVEELRDLIRRIDEKKYAMSPTSITPENVDQAVAALEGLDEGDRKAVLARLKTSFPDDWQTDSA